MAEDNIAIRIDDFDTHSAVYNATTEFIEFGLEYGESMDLLPGVNGNDAVKSIKSSLSSTISQAKTVFSYIWMGIKWFLSTTKVFWFVVIYSVIGALLFIYFERDPDVQSRIESRDYYHQAREVLAFNIRQIQNSQRLDAEYEIKQAIIQFEQNVGLYMPSEDSNWTFWMAILYAGTIYTTIGYGNIACVTTGGRLATIAYALVGIPMMIIVLDQLGDFLLRVVKKGASVAEDVFLFVGVKTRLMRIRSEKSLSRYIKISKKMAFIGLSNSYMPPKSVNMVEPDKIKQMETQGSQVVLDMSKSDTSDAKDDWKRDPPVLAAVTITVVWIFASAAVFCLWEDWTYFTSIYFFFISTSTIGFGDISPDHPEYMMATFGIVFVGLSLVSVCINVVQEYVQQWYMSLLQKMLQQYIDAQESGDENAAKGFITGFSNNQMKYLMPLVSKNSGQKAMEQLKKEAKEKGFELPPALTDLNPATGKPNFLNASEKQIDQIIEKAMSEGKLTPVPPVATSPHTAAVSIQASFSGDREIAQTQTELSWEFFEARTTRGTQFEPALAASIGVDVGVEVKPKMTTTAIQPEVSSIFQFQREIVDDDGVDTRVESVVMAKREARIEEGGNEELSEEEVGILRFLKNTGTQVQAQVQESGDQTVPVQLRDSGQQIQPECTAVGEQTDEKQVRATKTQTKLTTCIQSPEEFEEERRKMKEERKKEFIEERAARISKATSKPGKKITLSPAEKQLLSARLLKLRQTAARALREEGKPIEFNVPQEQGVLVVELKKMRKVEQARARELRQGIEQQKQEDSEEKRGLGGQERRHPHLQGLSRSQLQAREGEGPRLAHLGEQRSTVASVSTADDDVFLADSEADSSTSTLPGPDQFAVPSRLDFSKRREQKKGLRRPTGDFGAPLEVVEQRILLGDVTPDGSRIKTPFEAGEGEEESDADEDDVQIAADAGITLVHTPPGLESGVGEREMFAVVRPKSTSVASEDTLGPGERGFGAERAARMPFESLSEFNLQVPRSLVELSQSTPVLTQSSAGYEEITLNVELICRSIGSFDSTSQSRSVAGSISQSPGLVYSPTMQVHPEMLGNALQQDDQEADSLVSEDLPIDELESLIDYDDLFSELDALESQHEDNDLFYISATGVQTDMSYFSTHSVGLVTDPEKFTHGVQTDLTALDDEKAPRSIAEALMPKHATISAQTAPMTTTDAVQTDAETEDKCVGGQVDYESAEVQTLEKETRERKVSVQTDLPTVTEEGVQVETETKSQSTETDQSISDTAVQPSDVATSIHSVQTEEKKTSDSETQAGPRMSDSSTETDQAHVATAVAAETMRETRDGTSQTDAQRASIATAVEGPSQGTTATQPEVSTIYRKDPSEQEPAVTYMVDTSTEQDYDLVMQHASTQHRIVVDDFSHQHSPDFSHASSQAGTEMKTGSSQTTSRSRPPSPSIPSISYASTGMQTDSDDHDLGNPPILLAAHISMASSPSSSAIYEDDGEDSDETEPPDTEGEMTVEATFPASFLVQSITLTSNVETQVDFIHADAGTQIAFGDFSRDAMSQAAIPVMDRQTSLDSTELEPLESGFRYSGEPGHGFVWSDFDFVPEFGEEDWEGDEEERASSRMRSPIKSPSPGLRSPVVSSPIPGLKSPVPPPAAKTPSPEPPAEPSAGHHADAATPGPAYPEESQFVRKKVVRKISLEEMDEMRRQRMMDIGIQTGVLARVQHIYSKRGGPGGADKSGDIKRITLRKFGSTSTVASQQPSAAPSSVSLQELFRAESLSRLQATGSVEDVPGPSSESKPPQQPVEPELNPRERARNLALHGQHWERQQTVGDLRSRLEKFHKQAASKSSIDLFAHLPTTPAKKDDKKADDPKEEEK